VIIVVGFRIEPTLEGIMLKIVTVLAVLFAAALATPTPRHRYQQNVMRLLGEAPGGGRVVGGADANIEDYPYQVVLFFNFFHTCGGSILNPTTIITATHCTFNRNQANFQILPGQSDIRETHALVPVAQVIQHPDYDDWTIENDIDVLKLAAPLSFGPGIQAIPLPVPGHNVPSGNMCDLTGWGTLEWGTSQFPNILQHVLVPAMTNVECQAIYVNEDIIPSHICAGAVGTDACQGDSGGPLAYNGVHVGIVSWGYFCAREYPTVYTRVSEFLGFILSNA